MGPPGSGVDPEGDIRLSLPRRALLTGMAAMLQRRERRAPFSSPEALERRQRRRLRHIVTHAYRNVPYYRETMRRLELTPDDLNRAEDLAKLPLIERDHLQRDPEYFLSERRPDRACLALRSGGSTSTPVTVLEDPADVVAKAASAARVRPMIIALSGRRWGRRVAWIAPPMSSGARFGRFYRRNLIGLPDPRTIEIHVSMQATAAETLAAINEFQPQVIAGFGSVIEELFVGAVRRGQPVHLPKVVAYAGDHLSLQARALISQQLGIAVLSVYQAIESPQIGFECEQHAGYHLNVDLCPVRILDHEGRESPHGEPGEVVISNLVNRTTVLLNYRLGDVASFIEEPCGCGRTLPLISYIQGRTSQSGIGADGRPLHTQLLVRPFSADPEVWGYRIEQRAPGRFEAQVLAAPGADPAAVTARVRERFSRMVGPEESIALSFVDELPRTPAGKVMRVTGGRRDQGASKYPDTRAQAAGPGS